MKIKFVMIMIVFMILIVGCGANSEEDGNNRTTEQAYNLSYDGESIQKSFDEYAYFENPYYLEGLTRYIGSINAIFEQEGAKQQIEIISVEDVMKLADISNKLQESVLQLDGTNVLENSDIVMLEDIEGNFTLTGLLDSDTEKAYFEVSSKAKGADLWGNAYYYYGDLKKNRPEGEGILFQKSDSGIRPIYIGNFEDGKFQGKGVMLKPENFGSVMISLADHEKNMRTGDSIMYDIWAVANDFDTYLLAYDEYNKDHLSNYDSSKQNAIMESLVENSPIVELMTAVAGYFTEDEFNTIKIEYPVIRGFIEYEGELKKDKYHGEGCLYDGLGLVVYEGGFSKGKFHGDGVLYYEFPDKIKYEGDFKSGKYDGKGTLYNKDGSIRKEGKFNKEEIIAGFEFGMLDMSSEFISISEITTKAWYENGSKALFENLLDEAVLNEVSEDEITEGSFEDALYFDAWDLRDIGSWYSDETGYYMIPFVDAQGKPFMAITVENGLREYATVYYIDCVYAKENSGKLVYKGKLYEASNEMPQIGTVEAVWDSLESVSIVVTEGDQSIASNYTYYGPTEY